VATIKLSRRRREARDDVDVVGCASICESTWLVLGKWPTLKTPVRFYVGQPEPADPSRFTIDYAFGDETGTLVGQLQDDGTVTFSVKDGPLAKRNK
jgi:hypothetical protein